MDSQRPQHNQQHGQQQQQQQEQHQPYYTHFNHPIPFQQYPQNVEWELQQQQQQQQQLLQNHCIWTTNPTSNVPVQIPPPPPPPLPSHYSPPVPMDTSTGFWLSEEPLQQSQPILTPLPPPPPPSSSSLRPNNNWDGATGISRPPRPLPPPPPPPPPSSPTPASLSTTTAPFVKATTRNRKRKKKKRKKTTIAAAAADASGGAGAWVEETTKTKAIENNPFCPPALQLVRVQQARQSSQKPKNQKQQQQPPPPPQQQPKTRKRQKPDSKTITNQYCELNPTVVRNNDNDNSRFLQIPLTTNSRIGSTLSLPGQDSMELSNSDDDDNDNKTKKFVDHNQERPEKKASLQYETPLLPPSPSSKLAFTTTTTESPTSSDVSQKKKQRLVQAKDQLLLAQMKRKLATMKKKKQEQQNASSNTKDDDADNNDDEETPNDNDSTTSRLQRKTKGLKKHLESVKVKHATATATAAAVATQERYRRQQYDNHNKNNNNEMTMTLQPLTALQQGGLDSLCVTNIENSGPSNRVRFPVVFSGPNLRSSSWTTNDKEDTSSLASPLFLDQFADASDDEFIIPVVQGPSVRADTSVPWQFDSPEDDEESFSAKNNTLISKSVAAQQEREDEDISSLYVGLPKLLPPGRKEATDRHLKSITVLKRKMELKRKAFELKEKLQRLGNASAQKQLRFKASWRRLEAEQDKEGEAMNASAEDNDDDHDDEVVRSSMLNSSKEELEQRRLVAQQNIDVSQTKHLVQKQTHMLMEQKQKVNDTVREIQECRDLIVLKRKQLNEENKLVEDLQIRKSTVDEMIQQQIELVLAKRKQLHDRVAQSLKIFAASDVSEKKVAVENKGGTSETNQNETGAAEAQQASEAMS